MGYEVINTTKETLINDSDTGLKVRISLNKPAPGTAFAIGTLYTEKSGFIPLKVYLFHSINEDTDSESLKKVAIFFFATLLDTDLYVVEVPRDSSLFTLEAERIFGGTNYERAV